MIREQKLDYHKYKDIIFERLNSKYNRLWEQLTNISVLLIEVIVAYFLAVMAYETNTPTKLITFNYITLLIFIIIIGVSLSLGRLELERTETKRDLVFFLNELEKTSHSNQP